MKTIKRLIEISEKTNIADDLTDERLTQIGSICKDAYKSDLTTCSEKFTKIDEYIEIAKQKVEDKTDPWPGAANAKYPLLTVAAMQFNARAFPALVPAGKVVKARAFGTDPAGQKSDRSERISSHMSYQLYYGIEDWVENMDQMLLLLPIVGGMYKKTYQDTLRQKAATALVQPKKLVVNNDTTTTLEACPRVTEILTRLPSEIEKNIAAGIWKDQDIKYEDEEKEVPEEILEQHVIFDIYDDGNKEPYIITMHSDTGKIFRIRACFDQDTISMDLDGEYRAVGEVLREIENKNIEIREKNIKAQMLSDQADNGEAIKVKELDKPNLKNFKAICVDKIQYYTEYAYLPSFDGKFYKAGLGDLIASISGLVDTNLNQMLDAGTLANLQGGYRQKVGKSKSGVVMSRPGEYVEIDTGGLPLRDSLLPFNFQGPSGVLFNLLGMLIEAAKDITSIKDIMVGEAPAGETATTTMIKREEGMKVFSAIYKRIYRSMGREFQKLFSLNRKYLKQEEYFRFGDAESYVQQEDYEDDSIDIIPVADPNESTMADRLLKAQALMQFMRAPNADPEEIQKNYMVALGIDETEYERFFPGAQEPPPNPETLKTEAETREINERTKKIAVEIQLTYAKAMEALANAESKEIGTQIGIYQQALEQIGGQFEDKQAGVQGVADTPGNIGGVEGDTPGMDTEGGAAVETPIETGEQPGSTGDEVQGIAGL